MREPLPTAAAAPAPGRGLPHSMPGTRVGAARPWDALLVCVAVYIATAVGRVHQLFAVLLPLKLTFVAAALAVALYGLQQSGPRRLERVHSRTTTCLIALVAWAALSVPGALNQGMAFDLVTGLVKAAVMYVVIAGSVRGLADVERLMLIYFGSTVVYATVVLSRFQLGGDDWRLSRLYNYDANDFATLIATAMPLGLYFVLGRRGPLRRALALLGLGVLAVGLIRAGSRGGFLALLAVAAFILVRFTTLPVRSRALGLAVILAVVAAAASDQYWTQMQTIINPHQDYNLTAEAGRVRIWERGLGYMAAHPLLGLGAGNFEVAEGTISPVARRRAEWGKGAPWMAAHNSLIQVGAELGVPGLALFAGFIASAWASLRRVRRAALRAPPPARNVTGLAQSLMAALVGFIVGALFLSLAYADMLYTLVALTAGLEKAARLEIGGATPVTWPGAR